jgi:hypothetical protein
VIEIDGYVTEEAVIKAREVLEDPRRRRQMVEKNYDIAKRCFSYSVLRKKLYPLIFDSIPCNPGAALL